MDKTPNPFSYRNLLALLGANLGFSTLLGLAANFIQVLSFANGIWIIATILMSTVIYFCGQLYRYYNATFKKCHEELCNEKQRRAELQRRLDLIVREVRSRSTVNPRPLELNAYICYEKLKREPMDIGVLYISERLIVIDKGKDDGLDLGVSFTVSLRGQNQPLEVCFIDRVDAESSWLAYNVSSTHPSYEADDLKIQLAAPSGITEAELEIANLLLIAEGFAKASSNSAHEGP
jgi:hypothetical protein